MVDKQNLTIDKCRGNAMFERKEQGVFAEPIDILVYTPGPGKQSTFVCEYVRDGNCYAINAIGGREGFTPAPCLFLRRGDRVVVSTEEI